MQNRLTTKGRHLPLITLVTAFLVLDFSLLYISYSLSQRLQENAQIINLSGRQRMLTQYIAKDLLVFTSTVNQPQPEANLAKFVERVNLFDMTLKALANGGRTFDANGTPTELTALSDQRSQELISQANALWQPIYTLSLKYAEGVYPDSYQITQYAATDSEQLLTLMNDLTNHAESLSQDNIGRLQTVQLLIFFLVLMNFFAILIYLASIYRVDAHSQQQLKELTKHLKEAVFLIDAENVIVFANATAIRLLNESEHRLVGTPIQRWLGTVMAIDQVDVDGKHFDVNTALVSTLPNELRMVSLSDITEQVNLKTQSTTDPLTGLLNRIGLSEYYQKLCDQNRPVACLFLDLDGFKQVNDEYGHAIGDLMLHIIAKRFISCVKYSDAIARIGGDEFVILFAAPDDPADLDELRARLEETVNLPIQIEQKRAKVGVSIGLAIAAANSLTLNQLLMKADKAMYRVKTAKKQ